ncbi:MAG: PaaI family thioesterase [Caldimonas sp.]
MRTPFVDHVGMHIAEQRAGHSRCTLSVEDCHFNSGGTVHGGVLFSLADTAMGAALHPTLGPGEGCATIETKINYFKPVASGAIVCTAEIVNKGRTVASLEACVYAGDVLVAKANGSFSIFRRRNDEAS